MRQNNVNIYPRTGIVASYQPNFILRFRIALDAPTHISAGNTIRSIPGAEASLYLVENPGRGASNKLVCPSPNQCNQIDVARIENGRIFVQRSGQHEEYLLESWFVEPVPPQQ